MSFPDTSATSPLAGWSDGALARIRSMDEEWRVIPGYDDYEVSSLGRVRSWRSRGYTPRTTPVLKKMRFRAKDNNSPNTGYWDVHLSSGGKERTISVHVLVAAAFIGPRPEGMQVAHNDGNGANNEASNLRYATPSENAWDKLGHGSLRHGEQAVNNKLSSAQVEEIRARYAAGELQKDLAVEFDISAQWVSAIVRGQWWKHSGGQQYSPLRRTVSLNEQEMIRERVQAGELQSVLAEEFGVSTAVISRYGGGSPRRQDWPKRPLKRLSVSEVLKIRERSAAGAKTEELVHEFGVSNVSIRNIVSGRTHSMVK